MGGVFPGALHISSSINSPTKTPIDFYQSEMSSPDGQSPHGLGKRNPKHACVKQERRRVSDDFELMIPVIRNKG